MSLREKLYKKLVEGTPQFEWDYNYLTRDVTRDVETKEKLVEELKQYDKYHDDMTDMTDDEMVEAYYILLINSRIKRNGFYFDGDSKNTIKLDNGKYIYFHFGKYKSNLNLLVNYDHLINGLRFDEPDHNFNLKYTGDLTIIKGRHFISKKGSNFFDISDPKNQPHALIKIN